MAFISAVEMIGTVAFAISGALVAIEKNLDYYGIGVFAIVTATGGGIIRDLLIGKNLPVSLENPTFAVVSIISAAAVVILYKRIIYYRNVIQFFDAVGLAAFTAIGAQVAVENEFYHLFVIMTLAVLTGTGGGVIRDVFAREIPFVFQKEIYAVACLIGAIMFFFLFDLVGVDLALYICFAVTLLIRLFAMKKDIHLSRVNREM